MKSIHITLETGNAAFDYEPASELARILRKLANKVECDEQFPSKLYDVNGNQCGAITFTAANAKPDPVAAAAHDLLAALEYLLEQTIVQDQQYSIELSEGEAIAEEMALAAIAKARG